MSLWPGGIPAFTLFVQDLDASKEFYQEVFGLPVTFEDESSAVFTFGNTMINLLTVAASGEGIELATVAAREAGARLQLTISVEDVDAICRELASRGVQLLNGPIDRSWGIRTACFSDPDGHIWVVTT